MRCGYFGGRSHYLPVIPRFGADGSTGFVARIDQEIVLISPGFFSRLEEKSLEVWVMNLELNPELEARLVAEADRQGCSAGQYTQRLLEQNLPGLSKEQEKAMVKDRLKAIALLQSWMDEGDGEAEEGFSDELLSRLGARSLLLRQAGIFAGDDMLVVIQEQIDRDRRQNHFEAED
jgi:hypothetical protein